MMKYLTLIFLLFPIIIYGQNVGIGTTSPDASAKLEIQSSTGGVLIPRLSTAERDLVPTPATGLLIFNASESRFEYYSGSAWMPVDASTNIDQISDEDNDTKVEVERSPDEDEIYFTVGGKEVLKIDTNTIAPSRVTFLNSKGNIAIDVNYDVPGPSGPGTNNISLGRENHLNLSTGSDNISIGNEAGRSIGIAGGNINMGKYSGSESQASFNINIGENAGRLIQDGHNINIGEDAGYALEGISNIAIGSYAGRLSKGYGKVMIGFQAGANNEGDENVYIGRRAGEYSLDGEYNTFVGTSSGHKSRGNHNAYLGYFSGYTNTTSNTSSRNTILGSYAGYNNIGSDNVLIGYQAGYDELGSNKLYISNDSLDTPLIYGEFDSKKVEINESIVINNTSNTYSSLLINQAGAGKLLVHTNGGLSVGTDDLPPSNGLRVEGLAGALSANLKVDGDGVIFRDEALKYISFGPPALLDNPATGLVNSGTQFTKTIPDDTFVWAAINLPHGAKLKRWSVYFRGARNDIIRGQLYRKAINSNSATSLVAFADYGDESIVKHWSFNTLSEVIDNENYTYFFRLEADSPSSEMYVEGVRFAYE